MLQQAKKPTKKLSEKKKKKTSKKETKTGGKKDYSIDDLVAEEQEVVGNFHQEGGQ